MFMAKYDRRILVPYLQDICSLELLAAKLEREIDKAGTQVWIWESKVNEDTKPEEVQVSNGSGNLLLFGTSCIAFIIAVGLFILGSSIGGFFGIIFNLAAFVCVLFSGFVMYLLVTCGESSKEREEKIRKYNEELRAYEAKEPERAQARREVNAWREIKDISAGRLKEVERLREQAYAVNVIPRQYRNIYAVHYLYEYFATSHENDLDRVIQTFILEEIKSRLDQIIEQQTEMILNQRCIIAKQEQGNKILIENHRAKMQQLAMLNENSKYQTEYLQMINANLAVSNYFAYQEYIHHR